MPVLKEALSDLNLQLPESEERECIDCGRKFRTEWRLKCRCDSCIHQRFGLTAEQLRYQRAEESRRQAESMGLTGRLARMTLSTFDAATQPDAMDLLSDFLSAWPKSPSLAFLGSPGPGKTHLACGLLLALAQRGVTGRYVDWPTVSARLKTADDRPAAERELLAPLGGVPLLVLDDCGREKPTEHMGQWLDVIINERWVGERPTVIIANLSGEELEAWMGPAAASRFFSTASILPFNPGDGRYRYRRQVDAPIVSDPTQPCHTCAGAGWVLNPKVAVGRPERLMRCPTCCGQGY